MSVALSLALLIFAFSYFNRLTSAATGTELYDELFPLNSTYSLGFTTASLNVSSNIETVDLSSTGLNIIGRSPAPVAYSGKQAFQAIYPKGAYAAVNIPEGLSFYVNGSDTFAAACAAGAKEVVVSYSVFFEKDFGFAAGGKIPGGFGGVGNLAHSCSGGRTANRDACFSLRLMWRAEGKGELAVYLPITSQNVAAQSAIAGSVKNPVDGSFSVGRGAFTFPTGEWVTIHEYVKLNDPASAHNGEVKLFIDGNLTVDLQGVALATKEGATFQGIFFQTFFGGSSEAFASPQNQSAWFADVSGAVVDASAT